NALLRKVSSLLRDACLRLVRLRLVVAVEDVVEVRLQIGGVEAKRGRSHVRVRPVSFAIEITRDPVSTERLGCDSGDVAAGEGVERCAVLLVSQELDEERREAD